ncbi:hypothetical protein [Schlesneria paludicola]|uniref:hypothetical protein n=1 Tax=Schlesneria paludicola TaxID=360056 RepID=UPI00031ED11E|nr:hypothetical protein [Schlesneria paludicola]
MGASSRRGLAAATNTVATNESERRVAGECPARMDERTDESWLGDDRDGDVINSL